MEMLSRGRKLSELDNVTHEEGHSSESIVTNTNGSPREYDSSDTSLKLGCWRLRIPRMLLHLKKKKKIAMRIHQARRTPEVLDELKVLFGTVTAIPVQVLLAGACIQVSEGFSSSCQQILEEFLGMWRCVDEQYYVLIGEEANVAQMEKCVGRFVLKVDEYMEVAEIYVVNILGMVSRDMDVATSWVDKAVLPEGRRQELLRRLHSLCSLKATISSQSSPLPTDAHEGRVSKKSNLFEGSPEVLKAQYRPNGEDVKKQAILRLSGRVDSWFGCFRTITLKFGSVQFVISRGKILLGSLMLFMYYILRRKRETIKRMVRKQALSMKKALVDLWQLAFSYQVNPLAARSTCSCCSSSPLLDRSSGLRTPTDPDMSPSQGYDSLVSGQT